MTSEISVIQDGLRCQTIGLLEKSGYEISAFVDNPSLVNDCSAFVRFIGDYVADGHLIRPAETVQYGHWLTKAEREDDNRLTFWEYDPQATDFVFGVNTAVTYWREQNLICQKAGTGFAPPLLHQMVVISDGVFEGDAVQGVRYPSPDHMSGWWITTDRYNGNSKTLKTVHAHHISAERPDLVKFLALPFGHRFFSLSGEVWFDPKAAGSED